VTRPQVRIVGRQTGGVIRGITAPFASIEAVNASASPAERVLPRDSHYESVVIARADARGRFSGALPMMPEDVVRIRARAPSGAAGGWTAFRARGLPGQRRAPTVAVIRLGLRDLETGRVRVFNLSPTRPIAEPHAELFLTNTRTGEELRIVTNERGSIDGRTRIGGRAGDSIAVTARGRSVGTLVVPSPALPRGAVRPGGWHVKIGFVPDARHFDVPLFTKRPRAFDVLQSELSDCYLASAAAAIAHVRPECIERAIAPVGSARYRVRFKLGTDYRPHDVIVTSDLYVRPSGDLLYGRSRGSLWWPVLEKAFAVLKGSYKDLGRGGTSHRVFQLLLGRPPRHFFLTPADRELVWSELVEASAARRPVVAGTYPTWSARRFHATGIVPDHAYAVLGCIDEGGVRKVTLRNPWGEDVGPPARARTGGALDVDLDELVDLFQVISTVR